MVDGGFGDCVRLLVCWVVVLLFCDLLEFVLVVICC